MSQAPVSPELQITHPHSVVSKTCCKFGTVFCKYIKTFFWYSLLQYVTHNIMLVLMPFP